MQKINNYKGYSLFNEVTDAAVRTWNRCTILRNIKDDHNENFARGYAEHMDELGRMQMTAMYQYMATKGVEAVRLEIYQGRH